MLMSQVESPFGTDPHGKQITIEHLVKLACEESNTMPRGLTRDQRRAWAKSVFKESKNKKNTA
jgi:hypothetical protein